MDRVGSRLREKILIADQVRLHRTLAADILARCGYATVQAETCARALDLVNSESPDLIILDAQMPDLDSRQVVQRLKDDPFTHHIPVLLLSSQNGKTSATPRSPHDADGVLTKPFQPGELIAQVEALLERSYQLNPMTQLPAAPYLHRQINARLAQNQRTAVVYVDIDNFRPFQQAYGSQAGDKVLQQLAALLVETLPARDAFVSHLSGDDFVAVVPPETVETFAQTLIDRFRSMRDSFYPPEDVARNHILVQGRRGENTAVPLMTLSAALLSNEQRVLVNYMQVTDILEDVMNFLKNQGGGNWARDRRTR